MSITIPKKEGKLIIITGPMFAGKTTKLLEMIADCESKNVSFAVFKPKIDTRYHKNKVVSHDGKMAQAMLLETDSFDDLLLTKAECIFIDEFQFFAHSITKTINELLAKGKKIILSGLNKDFDNQDFGQIPYLMSASNQLFLLEGCCAICNKPSTHTFRKIQNTKQVVIGDKEMYLSLCNSCYTTEKNNYENL